LCEITERFELSTPSLIGRIPVRPFQGAFPHVISERRVPFPRPRVNYARLLTVSELLS
jgi:hypothetical protein